jgi:50S ribosomal protein L16 3-hydroxylase
MILGAMPPAVFLKQYWQKRPLLIKNAFPGFRDPLSAEELAGLACEPEAEARLVFTRKHTWELQSGPFKERDFTALPTRNWTLLVQAVDQWVPGVKDLLRSVAFLPAWRVDDVMLSYATPNGGVGPHFDYYDVFLVQGQGSRVWKTGQHCDSTDLLRTGSGLKLLKNFRCEHEWLLEAGDVLYVPPGLAHWGVSRDNSLCYSIGFRAPSLSEMLLSFSETLSEQYSADRRYTDPQLAQPLPRGELGSAALRQARRMLQAAWTDDAAFMRWFGCHVTEPKYPELIQPATSIPDLRRGSLQLTLNPASRLAWQQEDSTLLVFADGVCHAMSGTALLLQLVQQLAQPNVAVASAKFSKQAGARRLLETLLAQGAVVEEDTRQ